MSITRPLGFRAAAATAGLKPSGKPDVALIVCDEPGAPSSAPARPQPKTIEPRRSSGAVFTRNVVVGAPLEIARIWRTEYVAGRATALRGLLINAGCANAATGQAGIDDANQTLQRLARELGCSPAELMPSSTGVIGRRLPVEPILKAIPGLVASLSRGEAPDAAAAAAIMTTDLTPKTAHREFELRGHQVHIGAIAKGSGMIAPRMDTAAAAAPQGTMLAFITTDAAVHGPCLQAALEQACEESFDRISVDAHPSCSDTVFVMASGAVPIKPIHREDPEFHAFRAALKSLCQELATKVVRDGEGATRTFRVDVRGAPTNDAAVSIARAVVDSPLVKCAIHGKDPNWGRIVTAAGNAGVPFRPEETTLVLGGVEVYRAGIPTVQAKDPKLSGAMAEDPVRVSLTIGTGPGQGWMMGCDLSAQYVRINADYTT